MKGRPVAPRARRIAWKVASEPLIVVMTISALGMASTISSAAATSSSVVPSPTRSMSAMARVTASLTRSSLCPSRIAPKAAW